MSALAIRPASANGLLGLLPADAFAAIEQSLKPIGFRRRDVLVRPDQAIRRVYFPVEGLISMAVFLADGNSIEIAAIGKEGVLGVTPALGSGFALAEYIVQIQGAGYFMEAQDFRSAVEREPALRAILDRNAEAVSAHLFQSLACIAFHNVEARLCRWLLVARDMTGSDQLSLTQEFLAQMLAVQRTTVTGVAQTLERAGLIRYNRGHIDLLDVPRLKRFSCECYEQIKARRERAFRPGRNG